MVLLARLLLMLLLGFAPSLSQAADPFANSTPGLVTSGDEFLPVEQAYRLTPAVIGNQLVLHWQIAEGYYLYRHQFSFRDNASGADLPVALPRGIEKEDEYFGRVEVYYGELEAVLTELPQRTLGLTVVSQGCADAGLCYPPRTEYFEVDPVAQRVTPLTAPVTPASVAAPPAAATSTPAWPLMLLFAALGGAILNLMPCVFPVLSLKVLGFARGDGQRHTLHGLSYSAGVIASFLLVAGLLLALRSAGQAVGWGFQLQQSWFVAALAWLFFVMALSLSGFWELGGRWMGAGERLAGRGGYAGSFFTGVLATVVASPCTAPFMGSALGFAVNQPPALALAVFAALGAGMALPVLLLCLFPQWLRRLPRPGAWMERLKQTLAFPLYATAIWLCWIVGRQTGATGMALVLGGALGLTLALWLWRFGLLARCAAAAMLALTLSLLASPQLQAQGEAATTNSSWTPYRAQTLAELRAAGRPVFLNITADWCLTCLANERVALSSHRVTDLFQRTGTVYMKGDWTHYDPAITDLLTTFGRSGIPLYVYYPVGGTPVVLPQLLTPGLIENTLTP